MMSLGHQYFSRAVTKVITFALGVAIAAISSVGAIGGGTKGWDIIVNNSPVETVTTTDPVEACALLAANIEYVLFFTGTPPAANLGGGVGEDGILKCYARDSDNDNWELSKGPIGCDAGYSSQRGSCTKDPDRGARDTCGPNPEAGNPVSLSSSGKIEDALDFTTGGPEPLELRRYYRGRGMPSWRLGGRWRFDFDYGLVVSGSSVTVNSPDGTEYVFDETSPGIFTSRYKETKVLLVKLGTNFFTFTDENDREVFFSLGDQNRFYVSTITERNGETRGVFSAGGGYKRVVGSILVGSSFDRRIVFDYEYASGEPVRITSAKFTTGTNPGTEHFKIEYGYTTNNNLTTVTRFAKNGSVWQQVDQTTYHYEDANFKDMLTGITDARGVRYATWTYDDEGRPVSSQHAGGAEATTIAYNDTALTRTVTNALGKQSVYNFAKREGSMKLTSVSGQASANCPASTQSLAYNTVGQVTQTTDEEGRVTAFVRDTVGRPTSVTRGFGTPSAATATLTYHSTLNAVTQSVEPGLTTDFTWTGGKLTQVTQTDTTTQTVPYSTNGQTRTWNYGYTGTRLTSVDGPLSGSGDTVSYSYDSLGYLASVTNEMGHITTITAVDYRGQPTSITDPNSVVSNLTYDHIGRLKSTTVDPSGLSATTSIDYDAIGQVTKITRPNGAYLQYTWDDARRLTKIQDNTGASIEYDRDALGGITERRIKDTGGTILFAQTSTFDELGRLRTSVGAGSQTWTYGYDKTSNGVSVTDPRSNVLQRTFDPLNRLIRETDEETAQVNLTRNGKDEITVYSDPRALTTSYVRNGFGDIIQRVSPDSGTAVYEYNALSKVTKITDGRGVVTNLTYDNAGRVLTKQYPAATSENITFTWDSTTGGNKGKGRITRIDDASGSIERRYDALGRLVQDTKTTATRIYTLSYGYDADGGVSQITYPSGRIVTYTRDSVGRVSGVTTKKDASSATVTLASSVAYQPFGPLQSMTYGNGLSLWKTFTSDYLLDLLLVEDTSIPQDIIKRFHTRTDDINLTNIWDEVQSSRNESYWYTGTNRLQNADGPWGSLTYYYDEVGNRTYEILTQGSTTTEKVFGYPWDSNRLGSVTQASSTLRTFTHDGAGNITADDRAGTVYNYRYNNRGRIDRVSVGTQARSDFVYDALERLASRTTQNMTPAGTTHYAYDQQGHLLVEASNSGNTVREYIWLDDMPLAVVADVDTVSPKLWYVHADHLNRPIKMTDGTKAVVWDAVYRPFGEVFSVTGSASNNLRFPGQYFLIEAGLHYNWNRHYDPTLGRYLQPDPLEFVDGASRFAYALSAPTMEIDPEGLQIWNWKIILRYVRLYKNAVDSAKSASQFMRHLRDYRDASKRIEELRKLCDRAKGNNKKDLEKMLREELDDAKGHLKEMRQKWPDFMREIES